MEYLHKAQQWAGDQTTLEWYLFGGSVVVFQVLYLTCGIINSQGAKSKSCWISHVHCFFTVPSACLYWLTQPVDFWSSQWMLEGPGGGIQRQARNTLMYTNTHTTIIHMNACTTNNFNLRLYDQVLGSLCRAGTPMRLFLRLTDLNDWMRCTVAFSVGYFVNDMVLILMDPEVCMLQHALLMYMCIQLFKSNKHAYCMLLVSMRVYPRMCESVHPCMHTRIRTYVQTHTICVHACVHVWI